MKRIVTLLVLTAASFTPAQDTPEFVKARAAYALAAATPPTLEEVAARAVRRNVPLIIFVGQKCQRPDGCECEMISLPSHDESAAVRVVVAVPSADGESWVKTTADGPANLDLVRLMAHERR